MARRTPHHAERPQDRRVPLTPQFGEPPPSESPGSRVPPQRDFWKRSGQHEPRKVPGSRGALHRRHLLQPTHSHRLLKAFLTSHGTTTRSPKAPGVGCLRSAISGSEADSMSRGGYPVTGRPSSKSSSIRHMPSAKRPPQSAVFSFSADTETDAASRRSCPSTSRFVRATDSTKSCHGTSVMPTSPRWPFSPSSHRPVTG